MRDRIDRRRRLLLGAVLSGVDAAPLGLAGRAFAQGAAPASLARAPSSKRLELLRHIDAGVLDIGC
jgi:hypothetical protein